MSAQPSDPVDLQVARLEGAFEQVDKRLGSMEARLESLETKVDTRIGGLEQRLDTRLSGIESRLQMQFISLIVLVVSSIIVPVVLHYLPSPG